MTWFLFALMSVVFNAISNLLNKVLMKDDKSDPMLSAILFQLLMSLMFFILALFDGFSVPPLMTYPINYLLMGILYGLGTYCIFKAMKYLESSEASIISSSTTLVVIASAMIFLNEKLNFNKLIGISLIMIAVIGASLKKTKFVLNKGVFYALGMALFYGLATTNDAFLIKFSNPFSYLVFCSLFPGIFLILISPKSLLKINYYFKLKNLLKLFLFSSFYVAGAIGFYYALSTGGQVSQVSAINRASIVLTVVLAAIFLGERDRLWQKIIYGILVIVGVILLK